MRKGWLVLNVSMTKTHAKELAENHRANGYRARVEPIKSHKERMRYRGSTWKVYVSTAKKKKR